VDRCSWIYIAAGLVAWYGEHGDLHGHYGGDVVFSGHGAGGNPPRWPWSATCWPGARIAAGGDSLGTGARERRIRGSPYIRFLVADRPGIVAEITGALAKERINIRAIVQKPGYPQHALPFVVTVERASLRPSDVRWKAFAAELLLEAPLDLQMLE